jgi:GntR family transcriptional regulator
VSVDRIDPLAPIPPYRQIAAILKRRILSGQYPPNTRIPTESELVETYEVARTTARRAVGALREDGLVYTVPQRGTYVAQQPGDGTERSRRAVEGSSREGD